VKDNQTMYVRFEDLRDVGFFLCAGSWFVIYFANAGVITGSLMLILGADILIAGLLALRVEREAHDH
jgi:hypothetical protein